MTPLGVHSETGKLRRVIVCAPRLAYERLTPANCDALLFDDVFWVAQARNDHRDFRDKMTDCGVEVLEVHDVPFAPQGMVAAVLGPEGFLLPPPPNMMFTRDTSVWVYGGVTLNPMHWPARQNETLLMAAIYRFHPLFARSAKDWGVGRIRICNLRALRGAM